MKLELKNIKLSKGLSEETPAYTAVLHVDGVAFANVSNHGQGGCDECHPVGKTFSNDPAFLAKEREIADYFRSLPTQHFHGMDLPQTLEGWCHTQVWESDLVAGIKRDLSRKVMFTKADGKLYSMPIKGHTAAQVIAFVKAKGHTNILNELPIDEAVAFLKSYTE